MLKMKASDIKAKFGNLFVRGCYTKKDGSLRKFWGQLRTDNKDETYILYNDYRKHGIRRINLDHDNIIISHKKVGILINPTERLLKR